MIKSPKIISLHSQLDNIMWKFFYTIIISICLTAIASDCIAQSFLWDVDFKFDFDNKEYAHMKGYPSKTDFSAAIVPKVGLGFKKDHAIYLGGNFLRDFGKHASPKYVAEMLLYYQYSGKRLFINAGAFPSRNYAGYYFPTITSDRYMLDNVTEGALIRYSGRHGMIEALIDWTGQFEKYTRESFVVKSYGKFEHQDFPYLSLAYTYAMNHYSNNELLNGVVDNMWLYPHIGFNLAPLTPLSRLGGKLGWLNTFQNNRVENQGYACPGGFQMELEIEYKGFGVNDILYLGPNLMPYYNYVDQQGIVYGDNLYFSEMFYQTTSGVYNRLEAYWRYNLNDMLSVKISSVHHCVGKEWGWQQVVRLYVNLNNKQFQSKKKAGRHR